MRCAALQGPGRRENFLGTPIPRGYGGTCRRALPPPREVSQQTRPECAKYWRWAAQPTRLACRLYLLASRTRALASARRVSARHMR